MLEQDHTAKLRGNKIPSIRQGRRLTKLYLVHIFLAPPPPLEMLGGGQKISSYAPGLDRVPKQGCILRLDTLHAFQRIFGLHSNVHYNS